MAGRPSISPTTPCSDRVTTPGAPRKRKPVPTATEKATCPGEEQQRDAVLGDPVVAELERRGQRREVAPGGAATDQHHPRRQGPRHGIEGDLGVLDEAFREDHAQLRLEASRGLRLRDRGAAGSVNVDSQARAQPVVITAVSEAKSASVRESSRKPSMDDTSAAEEVPMTWTPGKAARTAAMSDGSKVS